MLERIKSYFISVKHL
uniref:Uncharacterized protein n=1 Tax=Rhizophora mucronata TaxID=61149 RepID=A0A2P2P3R7_RHIMU